MSRYSRQFAKGKAGKQPRIVDQGGRLDRQQNATEQIFHFLDRSAALWKVHYGQIFFSKINLFSSFSFRASCSVTIDGLARESHSCRLTISANSHTSPRKLSNREGKISVLRPGISRAEESAVGKKRLLLRLEQCCP